MKCVIYRGIEILHNATRSHQMKSNFLNFLGGNPQTPLVLRDVAWTALSSILLLPTSILEPPPPYTHPGYAPEWGARIFFFFFLGWGGGVFPYNMKYLEGIFIGWGDFNLPIYYVKRKTHLKK